MPRRIDKGGIASPLSAAWNCTAASRRCSSRTRATRSITCQCFFTSFSASVTHLLHVAHFSASDVATRSSSSPRSWPSEARQRYRQTLRRVQYPLIHCAVGPARRIHAFCSGSPGESLWARPVWCPGERSTRAPPDSRAYGRSRRARPRDKQSRPGDVYSACSYGRFFWVDPTA